MLNTKKVKEIKSFAKDDVKYWIKLEKERDEDIENGKKMTKEKFNERYPEGITTYYNEIYKRNNTKEYKDRLIKQFGYTDETLNERSEIYHEGFWASWQWWQKKLLEVKAVMAKYKPIFKEAEAFAKKVDVSDIKDGFPCGMAVLYLDPEMHDSDLGKALNTMSDSDSYSKKVCSWSTYKLPIKIPSYGQCMSFDERVCGEVKEFLEKKGIKAGVYSMID